MKNQYLKNLHKGKKVETSFMINKIISRDGNNVYAFIGDNTGEVKARFKDENRAFKVGDIITVKGTLGESIDVDKVKKEKTFNIMDYLPSVKRPIEDIMNEIELLSKEEFKSEEAIKLNEYFFKNEEFINKFKKAIGGVYQHHNYLGGLAEHTLNVMHLTKVLSYRYNCRYKEIAILGAKLHDIGKIYEMSYDGPFNYTLRGDMEGHIVIGVNMIEDAFKENKELYDEEFKERIKGIIVQHHGKEEYGSPKAPKTVESHIVHYADYVDAMMNKIEIVTESVEKGQWTPYERRIEGKIFV